MTNRTKAAEAPASDATRSRETSRPELKRRSRLCKSPILASVAFGVAVCGAGATVFWLRTSELRRATKPEREPVVFRVQSRSMEPTFLGPRFVWRCPECGESFETTLDVGSSGAARSFDGSIDSSSPEETAFRTSGASETSNADSPEARDFRAKARFFVCPRCGFDRVPAATATFRDGELIESVFRFAASDVGVDSPTEESEPRRWDVVVFRDAAGRSALKRVVGLPGETVAIRNGDVFVDGTIVRRSLDEIRATSVRIDSVEYRLSNDRFSLVSVAPVWDAAPKTPSGSSANGASGESTIPLFPGVPGRTTFVESPVSNESPTPRWNGADVAAPELVRDFWARFDWAASNGVPIRFRLLARRPERAFLLEYDEKAGEAALKSLTTLGGEIASGKTFGELVPGDFAGAPSESIPIPIPFGASESRVGLGDRSGASVEFGVYIVDGELTLTRDGEEIARFSTGDVDSLAIAAIAEPFVLFGDVARVGRFELWRDSRYSAGDVPPEGIAVPARRYLLFGDNSPASLDGRFEEFGTVDRDDVLFRVARRAVRTDDSAVEISPEILSGEDVANETNGAASD